MFRYCREKFIGITSRAEFIVSRFCDATRCNAMRRDAFQARLFYEDSAVEFTVIFVNRIESNRVASRLFRERTKTTRRAGVAGDRS